MSLENAELAKIAINSFVDHEDRRSPTCSAALCERIPGGDVDMVTNAVGADRRVGGPRIFKGGLGYGGPCFPRDNVALGFFAQEVGEQAMLLRGAAPRPTRACRRGSPTGCRRSRRAGIDHRRPRSGLHAQVAHHDASQSVALARLLPERGHDAIRQGSGSTLADAG